MILKDIFTITYGQREYHSKENLKPGTTMVISSQASDNGCYGFFDVPIKYSAPFITVPSTGSVGEAMVQEFDCCVDDNCLVLMPKKNMSLSRLYCMAAIIRLSKWRFGYGGRKVTPARIEYMAIPEIEPSIDYKRSVARLSRIIRLRK